ncbi:osteopetrosis-associated transmembrane protein 1 [Trichomycterus rosablanca]|uniref:osteopetrosis-associated transmembrane protein 1 n=1 Tax=Trichomycterus rosablanca TaxID=2290929 RepID=UPI002F356F77
MEAFRTDSCVLCLLILGGFMSAKVSVMAAGSSGDERSNPLFSLMSVQRVSDGGTYFSPLGLSASVLEELEDSDYCLNLQDIFGQRYASLVTCLVSNAHPVKLCQNCYIGFNSFLEIYVNISSNQMGPGNVSCQDILMRSDRLMLLYKLYNSLQDIWDSSACVQCLTSNQKNLSITTLDFIEKLNESLTCFKKYQQRNHSELCNECKSSYKKLNALYSTMSKNKSLCIDIEDAMNVTRRLWSKNYGCSFPREETVPVIAVSSFMLFLPLIFYLGNYLHSEQKKRKLIHPKRAKSSNSLMNIQDKFN